MKKATLLILLSVMFMAAHGQVTSLNEDFNTYCSVATSGHPPMWIESNVQAPVGPLGWACAPSGGRWSTPGIQCKNTDGTAYYLDTAWLLTPQLILSAYSGHVYFNFDSKYIYGAGKLSILVSSDYDTSKQVNDSLNVHWENLSTGALPVISVSDSGNWVTHQIDLTAFLSTPVYVAFKYTAQPTGLGIWSLDNVNINQTFLHVQQVPGQNAELSVSGSGNSSQITVAYIAPSSGRYTIQIYDMQGRKVCNQSVYAQEGAGSHVVDGLSLSGGMYLVRMSNENTYGTAKVIIP